MTRMNRTTLDKTLALGGVIVVLLQVLLIADVRFQVIVVLIGILINQVGVWGLAARLMPDRRTNIALRRQVDAFIKVVRAFNRLQIEGVNKDVEAMRARLHEAADGIVSVIAGIQETPRGSEQLTAAGVTDSADD
jgi:hypothetical protein